MPSYQSAPVAEPLTLITQPFMEAPGLPFANVLDEAEINAAFAAEGVHFGQRPRDVFTPALTLWAFLSQVIAADKSCRQALARVIVFLASLGRTVPHRNTGNYCKARAKIPTAVLQRLARQTAANLTRQAPADWRWHGRHALLLDGTTVSAADTEENQATFPQSNAQEPGLGFPILRLVVLLSLETGALHDLAIGPWKGKETGEPALFRSLLDAVPSGTVLIADRFYAGYFTIALAQQRGLDLVVRLHHLRQINYTKARRLGTGDFLVTLERPDPPDWMDEATYAQIPAQLTLRLVEGHVGWPGSRVDELKVLTTLLDPKAYPPTAIHDAYEHRWHAELDIRAIKQTLRMHLLRGQTPFMLEKELWVHALGYNLLRKSMAQAALLQGKHPRELSFTGARQEVEAAWHQLSVAEPPERERLGLIHLAAIAADRVGNRPHRVEPRAVKRRPKVLALLMKPRAQARAELLAGSARGP